MSSLLFLVYLVMRKHLCPSVPCIPLCPLFPYLLGYFIDFHRKMKVWYVICNSQTLFPSWFVSLPFFFNVPFINVNIFLFLKFLLQVTHVDLRFFSTETANFHFIVQIYFLALNIWKSFNSARYLSHQNPLLRPLHPII